MAHKFDYTKYVKIGKTVRAAHNLCVAEPEKIVRDAAVLVSSLYEQISFVNPLSAPSK